MYVCMYVCMHVSSSAFIFYCSVMFWFVLMTLDAMWLAHVVLCGVSLCVVTCCDAVTRDVCAHVFLRVMHACVHLCRNLLLFFWPNQCSLGSRETNQGPRWGPKHMDPSWKIGIPNLFAWSRVWRHRNPMCFWSPNLMIRAL